MEIILEKLTKSFDGVDAIVIVPVMAFYLFTQDKLMNIYGGGT